MKSKTLRVLLAGVILLFVASQSALADNVYATIRGTTADTTGAVVADAQVTATNTSTGVQYTTKSQANGIFQFLQLPIGTYNVTASKQGFKSFKSTGITLVVNQTYDLPVKLEVGVVSETVEVVANPVEVETTSIQQQTLIGASQIVDLPLIGRNFTQLEQLAPGVMASSDRFGTFSVNGSQTQQSSYLINGTDSNDIALNTPGFLPSPDAIQEFNLITSTINPEYGRNSGGIVNAVIKNGTNNFHGNIFDFYRDTFLNDRNFFTVGPQQPIFHQNVFGGTFGGPIHKGSTFFFLSYQGTYNATATPTVTTVLSDAQRGGAFGAGLAGSSPFAMTGEDGIVHPAGTSYATLFPTGHIPTVDFSSISTGLLNNFIPHSNAPSNGFSFNPVNNGKTDQGIARIDHNFNQNNQIWGIFAENNNRATQGLPFTGATLPGFGTFSTGNTKEITLAYIHTFSTSTLNEVRLGYHRFNFDAVEPSQVINPSTFGFTNIKPQNTAANQMPVIAVTGLFTLGFSDNGPQPRKDQNYQFTDNFTKIMGKHSLKFGYDVRRFQVDNPFFARNDGHFDFGGSGSFSTGNPGADFLLGIPDDYNQGSGAIINARAYEHYGYGQDQWKARPNLTLTMGAGYQIDTPYNNNQFGGLAFNCFIPGQQSTIFPTAPVGLDFPGDTGCTKSGTTTKYGHIAPRFGFAFSPQGDSKLTGGSGKTSIRGAFGVYFNRTEEETALQNLGAPPFGVTSAGVADAGGSPSFADPWTDVSGAGAIANKFPFVPPAKGSAVNFGFFEPMSLNTNDPNLSTPYSMNFNLNVQREFAGNTVVSLGYVGALGRHLYRAEEGNSITAAGMQACAASPSCEANRTFQHFFFPTHSAVDGSIFASVGTQFTDGTSNYNAMQINITKGMTHGLQLITSYTWSHAIDNGSGFENSSFGVRGTNVLDPILNIGDSGNDARQRLVLGYVYVIPSLHHMMNWAPDKVFGGWKISGISTFQSGFPINLSDSGFRSLTCDAFSFYGCPDNPNQVGPVTTLNPRTAVFGTKNDYFFDPNNFTRQVLGTYGNTGRDSIHGPGILNTDFALLKDTKLTERMGFQMGIEAYNIFNHTQFNNPSGNKASGNFGRVLSAANGRLVQLRAKFNF
ncbi:MAG TPA: carboxypeptidase regulatory-like domain-containing protein [Candidatus Angelobacter sp.]|nr:carboxypeptidase regulatory-like domain-containing protein [Candidatus Angelobacter sp.]